MFPGSTIFSVTTPSKGAFTCAKPAVVPAASPALLALSACAPAACVAAAAAAARASAARSAAVALSSSWADAERRAIRDAIRS
jgi:hypothetical protein